MAASRILVTGGTGYIGSHTVVELLAKGFEVVVADNLSNSRAEVLNSLQTISGKMIDFVTVDFCDNSAVTELFRHKQIDAVIHFAAFKAVNESVEMPMKYYRNNLVSLMNLIDAALKYKVMNLVFSSSCSVYGEPDVLPVNENAELKRAESPYGYTKQICEQMLRDISKVSKLKTIALRYFNPVGAHESVMIGEFPINPPNNLVPVITQTAIGKRKEMLVYGTDYNTKDGSAIRDYIHVVDIAKAHVLAIERMVQNKSVQHFELFNLGTGTGFTVLEVITAFERVSKQKLNYKLSPRREGDVEKIYADTKLANEVLGWFAEKSLDEMLDSSWRWEKQLAGKGNS